VSRQAIGSTRLAALDGMRGWASLSVVVFHLTWETFGAKFQLFRSFPVSFVANGQLAVGLFLMISGYVLTLRGWRSPDKRPVRMSILKRYFRLTIPIFVSVMVFWALMATGLAVSYDAAPVVDRVDWLGGFAYFRPDLLDALKFGLYDVFFQTKVWHYGPFLWTMTIELWGSYVVLALCYFELPRWGSYVPLGLLTVLGVFAPIEPFFPVAACYSAGALVALMVKDGLISAAPPAPTESAIAGAVCVAGLVAAAIAQMLQAPLGVTAILAMAIFVAALRCGPVLAFLSLPISQWLGRLSFPLYLVQIWIVVSLTSWLILIADVAGYFNAWTAVAIAAVSVAACLLCARLFMPIERLALRVSATIGRT
jgi:peptidoglycan/LPS O-acetylase OafA/YrhL